MAMKRKRECKWEAAIHDKDAHRLQYALRMINTPLQEMAMPGKPVKQCPACVSRAIKRLAAMSVSETVCMRDACMDRIKKRDKQLRAEGAVRAWNRPADTKTIRIRGDANGPLLIELLREAGGDTSQLEAVLQEGKLVSCCCVALCVCCVVWCRRRHREYAGGGPEGLLCRTQRGAWRLPSGATEGRRELA